MNLIHLFLVLLGVRSTVVVEAQVAANDTISACAMECVHKAVSLSPCAHTDAVCLCTDPEISENMHSCLVDDCTVLERLEYMKEEEKVCGKPVETQQLKILSSAGFGGVAMGSVLVRLWARWKLLGGFGADDWVIAIAGVLCFVFTVLGCVAVIEGFGLNIWDIPTNQVSMAFKVFYIAEPFYVALLALTKISIVLFMLRIFPHRSFRIPAYIVMGFIATFGVALTLTTIFQCIPISSNWESWKESHGHARPRCISANVQSYVSSAVGILQDVMILALPIPSLLQLRVAAMRRFDLFLMFGIGILVTVVSCIRLQFLVVFAKSDNLTWDNSDAMYWSAIEIFASFLITSLPAIRTLLSNKFPSVFGMVRQSYPLVEDSKPSSSPSDTGHALQSVDEAGLRLQQKDGIMRIHVVIDQQRLEGIVPEVEATSSYDSGERIKRPPT